jgi:hypothetical protein
MMMSTADAVAATTTETDLLAGSTSVGSLTFPANGFGVSCWELSARGSFGCASPSLTLRFKLGSSIRTLVINLSATAGQSFDLSVKFAVKALGAAGVARVGSSINMLHGAAGAAVMGGVVDEDDTFDFDTPISNTLVLTAQWSSSNASNGIQTYSASLRKRTRPRGRLAPPRRGGCRLPIGIDPG